MIKYFNEFINENSTITKPEIKPITKPSPTQPKRNPLRPAKPKVNPQPKNDKEFAINNIIKRYNKLKKK